MLNLHKKIFGTKNTSIPATNQKSARNFYFRPNFGHFKNFRIGDFRVIFQNFWLRDWLEGRNFRRIVQNFFGRKKYIFSGHKPKIGQKFLFPAEFWPFAKFSNMPFLGDFSKFLTLDVARGQKFRAFCQKIFSAKKICIFWPETKNRPEISISGHIMAILPISEMGHFR